jgi:type 1 glutamine amidotransferase
MFQKFLRVAVLILAVAVGAAPEATAQSKARKPRVVFVTGDHEYSSETTMPLLAEALRQRYGMQVTVLKSSPDHNAEENIPGLQALKDADLAVFFLRWRRLPEDQVRHIDAYLKSGKPVVGFRTSTHAFNYPEGHPLARWNAFGEFALGAPPGWGGKADHTHCGHTCSTDVSVIPEAASHPILKGVDPSFHVRSWLYKVRPDYPAKGATPLLTGKAVSSEKPGFADNPVAWTWKNGFGGGYLPPRWATPKTSAYRPSSAWSSTASTGPGAARTRQLGRQHDHQRAVPGNVKTGLND